MNMTRMNKFFAIIIMGTVVLSSCQKLDIKPPNVLSDDQLFSNEAGIETYLAQVYRKLPIEDFTYRPAGRGSGSVTSIIAAERWPLFSAARSAS